MDKFRTLPPLVRGKVTGVLDFYVDEIRLSRKILLMTDSFDLVLQLQWWGESLPALIRPKKLKIQGRINNNSVSSKSYYHSAKYQIKTNLDFFKSYLNTCEVVELCILEAVENCVIGSAFLRNLISIINNSNEFIKMPVIDYLGEVIGEVIIHVNFSKKSPEKYENHKTIRKICKNYDLDNKSEKQNSSISNKLTSNYFSLAEKTLFYSKLPQEKIMSNEVKSPISKYDNKINKLENSDPSSSDSEKCKLLPKEKDTQISDKSANKNKESCLPEIKALEDSSKVLCFNLGSKDIRFRTDSKNFRDKMTNMFNSNPIKCKIRSSEKLDLDYTVSNKKAATSCRNLLGKPVEVHKERACESIVFTADKFLELKDLQSIPLKESSNIKVLDYLLGSEMSRDEEEVALNDFKNMSPSHNFVNSISQLYLTPVKTSQVCENKLSTKSPKSTCLNFDFNNPIERNYYERFFLKSNPSNDFEIAEFLNKPENSFALDKLGTAKLPSESQGSSLKNNSEISLSKGHIKDDDYLISNKMNCARCKYYKKLDELDTVIESLKHFERRILEHEKNMQLDLNENSSMLNKKNQSLKES